MQKYKRNKNITYVNEFGFAQSSVVFNAVTISDCRFTGLS